MLPSYHPFSSRLQLVGITCMLLACKFEEVNAARRRTLVLTLTLTLALTLTLGRLRCAVLNTLLMILFIAVHAAAPSIDIKGSIPCIYPLFPTHPTG